MMQHFGTDATPFRARGRVQSEPSPKLLIMSRFYGLSGQPWLWRQVNGLSEFRKELVCWERFNYASQPVTDVQEHILGGRPAPYDDKARWLYRCRTMVHGNFYATVGTERITLKSLIRQLAPDAVLCNFGDIAMRMLPVAEAAGIPLVAYLHGDFLFNRNRWYRWSLLQTLHRFARIVVVTSAEREWLIAHGAAPENVHLIPCGAPTELFQPSSQAPDAGPHREKTRFVMASRLSPDKGCEFSLQAFAKVSQHVAGATLTVFGDGENRELLKTWVKERGLADRVEFRGYVDERCLAHELPQHDVFIQHSRFKEGSPVAIAEAMACGLPVVATKVGGIVDQVIPSLNGFLVAENDVEGMAEAMLKIAEDPALRRRLGRMGRQRSLTMFDTRTQTERLSGLLKGVIDDQGARGEPVAMNRVEALV